MVRSATLASTSASRDRYLVMAFRWSLLSPPAFFSSEGLTTVLTVIGPYSLPGEPSRSAGRSGGALSVSIEISVTCGAGEDSEKTKRSPLWLATLRRSDLRLRRNASAKLAPEG